jgi:hypothetical protein
MPFWRTSDSSRANRLRQLAEELVSSEVVDPIKRYNLRLAENQTHERASAEWHSAMMASMVCGMLMSLKTQQRVGPLLGEFRPKFLSFVGPWCQHHFLEIINEREAEYVNDIREMLKSDDKIKLEDLCVKIAGRVIGNYEEQSKATVRSWQL